MKKIKNSVLSIVVLGILILVSSFTKNETTLNKVENICTLENEEYQTVNFFVTHGHCSTPFAGRLVSINVITQERSDQGNPLENMKISFSVDPNTFNVCAGDDLTQRIKTPGLFIGENSENITFKSTNVYTMGLDWYQVNGLLAIKGVSKEVKFFVTGIRDKNETKASSLVLEGQMNLIDWGIDYDKIISGTSGTVPTKWMHINMKIKLS